MIEKILDFIKNNPVAVGAAVVGVVQAVFGVLVAFNLPITQEQQTSVIGLITAVIGFSAIVAAVVRGNVTPVNNPKDNAGNKLVAEVTESSVI